MEYFLQNELLRLTIQSKGAELCSIINKENKKEYLWQADPIYWNRHAPVLFPIVGKLKDNTYQHHGNSYKMSQHGFARDMEFSIVQESKEALSFRLEASEMTLTKYPFNFQFQIKYELIDAVISISYSVLNTDSNEMYFSVGAHPAFLCPIGDQGTFDDYYLEFSQSETSERYLLTDGVFNGNKEVVLNNSNKLPMTYALFEKDAIVFKDLRSTAIALKSRRFENGVKVSFQGFPYMGIWTKEVGVPFLCIEPWCGLADNEDASGELSEKEGIVGLMPDQYYERAFQIEIF